MTNCKVPATAAYKIRFEAPTYLNGNLSTNHPHNNLEEQLATLPKLPVSVKNASSFNAGYCAPYNLKLPAMNDP